MRATEDFIIDLFCQIDNQMGDQPKDPQAKLYPSEMVTLDVLFALKGDSESGFYRWVKRDYGQLFPKLPERTRLFRLLRTHQAWTLSVFGGTDPLGVADTCGIEVISPIREGRSQRQIGKKRKSTHRWIVGGKLGRVLNKVGLVCAWGDVPRLMSMTRRFIP